MILLVPKVLLHIRHENLSLIIAPAQDSRQKCQSEKLNAFVHLLELVLYNPSSLSLQSSGHVLTSLVKIVESTANSGGRVGIVR
jgi:hypothetical protein